MRFDFEKADRKRENGKNRNYSDAFLLFRGEKRRNDVMTDVKKHVRYCENIEKDVLFAPEFQKILILINEIRKYTGYAEARENARQNENRSSENGGQK